MDSAIYQGWRDLLSVWAVAPPLADELFSDVCAHYSGPNRFYHTLDHVAAVLKILGSIGVHARDLHAVKLAAWLHDVIYDSRAPDNEEKSAEYADRWCKRLAIPVGQRIATLILKTKTHNPVDDVDAQLLMDADLGILGASEPAYWVYAEAIRREYSWVPDPDYRVGRRAVLEQFLAKPRVFYFLVHLESPARQNMADEIARLHQL
jgi:predicted metal-dependent HD superfamily phosphohydrolase